ncbi:MAG: hypothetical protein ACI3XP_01220 [Eubacteriales bacterium]
MKKAMCLILTLLAVMLFTVSAGALSPGDPMGWVLYSDIVAYINDVPIRSYNIGGFTYVVAEDLVDYGFLVSWRPDDADGVLRIGSGSGIVSASYTPEPNTHRAGEPAMPYVFTKILTFIAGQPVWGANINGMTCVGMDDLAYFFADSYIWDPDARELRLTLRENCASVVPDVWTFTYDTPGYDKDVAVSGESAMWEFTKTADGDFALTDSSGAILFTPQITFGDDRMTYQLHFENKLLGLAGSNYFTSAPHSIAPHSTIARTITKQNLWLENLTFSTPDPAYFRGYVLQNPAAADELLARAAEATSVWRVYINGERMTGLPLAHVSVYYNTPAGRYRTSSEYTYLYDHRVFLSNVNTVRIEFGG